MAKAEIEVRVLDMPQVRAVIDEVRAEVERLQALVGDEAYDAEHWATCSREEAIRQANSFHENVQRLSREHDLRRDERDQALADFAAALEVVKAAEAWADQYQFTNKVSGFPRRDALVAAVDTWRQTKGET